MILITGGGGFLGLNIARSLANDGQHVLLVQRHAVQPHSLLASFWDKQVIQAAGDVRDYPFLSGLVKQYPIESIIHGAFDTTAIRRPETLKERLLQLVQVELDGIINLLEITKSAGLRRLSFISSIDCYRGWPEECEVWQENANLPPVSFSPITNCKRAGEQLGFLFSRTYGFSFVSLRIGRVYGPGAPNFHPISAMVENAMAGTPVNFTNVSGRARVHPVYAKDVGEATLAIHMAESLHNHIYNISDGSNPTMAEIADAIREFIPSAEINLCAGEQMRPKHSGVDVSRIQKEFGFVFRSLKSGIEAYIAWLRNGEY